MDWDMSVSGKCKIVARKIMHMWRIVLKVDVVVSIQYSVFGIQYSVSGIQYSVFSIQLFGF